MAYGESFWSQPKTTTPTKSAPTKQTGSYGQQFWGTGNDSGVRVATLPSYLGGGAYNVGPDKNKVYNTGHTNYGGLSSKSGYQRNDIVPVGLGGNNSDARNVKYQDQAQAEAQDAIEKQVINDYVAGKLSLGEARLKIITLRQEADNPQPSKLKNFVTSIPGAVKTVGKLALDLPKSLYDTFAKPSPTEKQVEKQLPTSPIRPLAQVFTRFTEPMIEAFGQEVGTFLADPHNPANLPQDHIQSFLNAANASMAVAGSLNLDKAVNKEAPKILNDRLLTMDDAQVGDPLLRRVPAQLEEQIKPYGQKFWNVELPKTEAPKDTSVTLQSGFNPGVDKFIAEDVKPALQKVGQVASTIKGAATAFKDAVVNILEPAKVVEKKFGSQAYSDVIRAIHTPEAETITFDNNFNEAEKFFSKFSKVDQENFNLTRGTPESDLAKTIQTNAEAALPDELHAPELKKAIKQASDYVYEVAKDKGLDLNYLDDYFYGSYKNPSKVTDFLDYWRSTDKYTKEKTLPTIADAKAFGLELKDPNPITNIKQELVAVTKRAGMVELRKTLDAQRAEFITTRENATPEQQATWKKIEDPVFKNVLAEPKYADFVNRLLETNQVSQSRFLRTLRGINRAAQTVKFFGSVFHFSNELKASIAQEALGVVDPRGYKDFITSFKGIDKTDPLYKDYVNVGGGHAYSVEADAAGQLSKGMERLMNGNYIGGTARSAIGLVTEKPFVPASPGFVNWMFEDFIPKLKFEKFKQDVFALEEKQGRPATDAEKINIIKRNQNFYGEMNERLFGRSGTATSALRLAFTAPGYGEGNFRVIGKALGGDFKSARFIANTIATTAVASTIGTKILTGKWPTAPKKAEDFRDLFKIGTNITDGNGDKVFYDLMTYDKDYWSIFGNVVTGQPGRILPDLTSRVSGMVATPAKILTDLSAIIEGKNVVDYKNDPVYYKTDSFDEKLIKLIKYEGKELQPISTSTFTQSKTKGGSLVHSILSAVSGIRPTTSEEVKRTKQIRNDSYALQDAKTQKQTELNALINENQDEAIRKAKEFNASQMKKLKELLKGTDINSLPQSEIDKYIIKSLKPGKAKNGTTVQSIFSK